MIRHYLLNAKKKTWQRDGIKKSSVINFLNTDENRSPLLRPAFLPPWPLLSLRFTPPDVINGWLENHRWCTRVSGSTVHLSRREASYTPSFLPLKFSELMRTSNLLAHASSDLNVTRLLVLRRGRILVLSFSLRHS